MANTKKTKTKTEEVIEETVVENETEEIIEEVVAPAPEPAPTPRVNKPKHDPNELITCRSVRFGELRLIGPKTNMPYSWSNEGDVREVEYQDLVSWKALGSRYLFEPMIIIEDEVLVDEWKADLGKLYEGLQEIDLKAMFKLPEKQFIAQLKKLPEGMKPTVQNMAYAMIQDRTIDSLRIIDAIDKILGTELKMMI